MKTKRNFVTVFGKTLYEDCKLNFETRQIKNIKFNKYTALKMDIKWILNLQINRVRDEKLIVFCMIKIDILQRPLADELLVCRTVICMKPEN